MKLKTDIFRIIPNRDISVVTGSVLVSEPLLSEPCFQRSVILLVEHEVGSGTMGLVLNKPSGLYLDEILPDVELENAIPVYCGGPVATNRLFYLHTLGHLIPGAIQVADNLFIDGDFDAIMAYVKSGNNVHENIRFFLGYSGWTHDQLKTELDQNVWVITPDFDYNTCISGHDKVAWSIAVRSLGEQYKPWLNFPKEPYLN